MGFTFSHSAFGDADLLLIKTDTTGNTIWTRYLGGNSNDIGASIEQTSDGGFTESYDAGYKDLWLVRLNSDGQTGIENFGSQTVSSFELEQNYPNPFNPSATINYSIPSSEIVQIKIYDALGTEIKTLVNEYKQAGIYKTEFDAGNLPSGVYFYRLISGNYSAVKKTILLR
ncbi:hypothetical protein BMS3Abin03_00725 [bacterium BMS3Abin03]|nr:hypothetical protein BMS3Abin03_00725 [bacterium BMS3Abin03]